jgi:hypothetical protein
MDREASTLGSQPADALDQYRQRAGLTQADLWLRYCEVGGMSTALEVEAFLFGTLVPSDHDHDLVAQALNDRFVELGGNHPVPYSEA